MDSICLTHTSAIEAHQYALKGADFYTREHLAGVDNHAQLVGLPNKTPDITRDEAIHLCETLGLSLPLHILVANPDRRRHADYLQCHVWREPPTTCLFPKLSSGLLCVPPELLFLQQAHKQSFYENVLMGFDMCGHYVKRPGMDTLYDQPALTSVDKLGHLLSIVSKVDGLAKARKALPNIRDNSLSPQESNLAMRLGLHTRYGGEGLGMPIMNQEIKLTPKASAAMGQNICYADLYLPSCKLDIEYNGGDTHPSQEKDFTRMMALAGMGISTIFVTNGQLINDHKYDVLISEIFRAAHKRRRHRSPEFEAKRYALAYFLRHNSL